MATGCFCVFPAAAVAVSEMKEGGGGVSSWRERVDHCIDLPQPLMRKPEAAPTPQARPTGLSLARVFHTHTPGAAGEALHVSRLYAKKREKKDNATR